MTAEQKREEARRVREAALSFNGEVARAMIELAESLEAEAEAIQPRNEPPLQAS
jgi:hypothetical protein